MSLNALELKKIAEDKFGPKWLTGLAYATGVSERTIRRWADGSAPITPRVEDHVRRVCEPGSVA